MALIELVGSGLIWIITACAFVITATLAARRRHSGNRLLVKAAVAFAVLSGIATVQWSYEHWPTVKMLGVWAAGDGSNREALSHHPMVQSTFTNLTMIDVPQHYRVGDRFKDCPNCPVMIVIPSGTSTIGKVSKEVGSCVCDEDGALPPVAISIRYRLAVGTKEVTVSEWNECVSAKACKPSASAYYIKATPSALAGYPAMVIWNDAKTYADWLSRKARHAYRLPSESEWEFAARGGTSTAFWWGNRFGERKAPVTTVNGSANKLSDEDALKAQLPTPVGRYLPNPFGLYDVVGNGFEWVEDCYADFVPDTWQMPLEDGQVRLRDFPRDGSPYEDEMTCSAQAGRDHVGMERVTRKGNKIMFESSNFSYNGEKSVDSKTTGTPAPVYARSGAPASKNVSGFRVALTLGE